MTTEKQIVYKPHVSQSFLFLSLTILMCVAMYFFFDFAKEEARCEVEIRKSDLKIEQIKKELQENEASKKSDKGEEVKEEEE